MKIIKHIILMIIMLFVFSNVSVHAELIDININNWATNNNLDTWNKKSQNNINNEHLDELWKWDATFFKVSTWWERWLSQALINVAKDLKNVFFYIAWLYFLILVLKLVFTDNTEEEVWKFKKWIMWISVWLIITQIAYSFVSILYDNNISQWLANSFINNLVYPLINLIETTAAFFFLAIAIYAFFRMVTAQWEEDKVTTWRMSILYSIIWFIVIKIARLLVDTIYWRVDCNNKNIFWIIEVSNSNCVIKENLSWSVKVLADVINWANSFIWIIVIILIIYAWVQVIFSLWNEDALKKAKNIILYIILWIILLFINYLILTFFIIPESVIN